MSSSPRARQILHASSESGTRYIYIYMRAHIVEIQIEEKYRPVVFLLVYIHTLDGDFIRIIDLVAR